MVAQNKPVVTKGQYPVVSFCTPCMGRLHHIRKTLVQNIMDNRDYPGVEFVLLDYNSGDGLEEWAKENMMEFIGQGVLSYYKNPAPQFFHHAHAKNMALRLGAGSIICLVDADNYTGEGFAFYIADKLTEADFLIAEYIQGDELIPINENGIVGRFATTKQIFHQSGGYDEAMEGWGYEDIDLNKRLMALGYQPATFDLRYLNCITHDDHERSKNLRLKNIGRDGIKVTAGGSCLRNFEHSEENLRKGNLVLNNNRYGCGTVYRNFGREPVVLGPVAHDDDLSKENTR